MFLFKMGLSPNGSKDFLHGAVVIVRTIGLFTLGTFQGAADSVKGGRYLLLPADAEVQQFKQFFFIVTLFHDGSFPLQRRQKIKARAQAKIA